MTREEWIKRYSDRLQTKGGMTKELADETANEAIKLDHEYCEGEPEECADDELSYWVG